MLLIIKTQNVAQKHYPYDKLTSTKKYKQKKKSAEK